MNSTSISEVGLIRTNNEDSYLADDKKGLFIVCDGMGGHNGGEVASSMAVNILRQNVQYINNIDEALIALKNAIQKANRQIWQTGKADPELLNMGTTIIAAAIIDNQMVVGNVGDSSLYLIRGEKIEKISRDHTLAATMLDNGLLKPEELRNNSYSHILTRALGVEETVEIDFFNYDLESGDRILLCSDGLTDLLDEKDIWATVTSNQDIAKAAQRLVHMALDRGGHDNITTILICI